MRAERHRLLVRLHAWTNVSMILYVWLHVCMDTLQETSHTTWAHAVAMFIGLAADVEYLQEVS